LLRSLVLSWDWKALYPRTLSPCALPIPSTVIAIPLPLPPLQSHVARALLVPARGKTTRSGPSTVLVACKASARCFILGSRHGHWLSSLFYARATLFLFCVPARHRRTRP
jgi:hypothetical protein